MGDDLDERAIFVQGPVVIFKWRNAEGWPVEYASANAPEVFGHSAEDFVSGRVRYGDVLHPDDAARVGAEVAAGTASGAAGWTHENYRVRHKDGTIRWLYDVTRVIRDGRGAATHYLGYVIDITGRIAAEDEARELERRLLHAQKLESLGLLAGGVAHDFNNLLTGILAQATLARGQLDAQPGLFRDAVDQIERLARRAAGLTRQLLAYSGKGRFVIEPIDLVAAVRELETMLAVVVPKTAQLAIELPPSPVVVMGDRTQIDQVLVNMITNACEALVDGHGTVTVRVAAEDHGGHPHARVEIEDTGRGMDDAVRARMFDPFFTTKGAGRGLGMAAVQGIVRAHHGTVVVTSRAGAGSRFVIHLPATTLPVAAPPPPTARALPAPGASILVVDDEAELRSSIAAILEHLGYRVALAADGATAIAQVEGGDGPFAAALVDMTMPALSGAATAAALTRLRPEMPIVMTSGFSEELVTTELGAVPVRGFLQKPFGMHELTAALATAVAR